MIVSGLCKNKDDDDTFARLCVSVGLLTEQEYQDEFKKFKKGEGKAYEYADRVRRSYAFIDKFEKEYGPDAS